MTVDTPGAALGSGDHVVHFYEHDAELAETVGRYLADAAAAGEVAIVIATEAHHQAFEAQLTASGIDPAKAAGNGTFVSRDATATMAGFISDGRIDGPAFHRVVGGLVREAAETGRPVRAYGEMVALLWEAGDVLAAIELERLWNELGRELRFSLLCAYRSQSVSGPEHAEALRQVCHLHSCVLPAEGIVGSDSRHRHCAGTEISGQFPAALDAPRNARRFVADALRRWGHEEALVDTAQLVLSELATNAVVHARTPFSVVARSEASGVRVSVHDAARAEPAPRGVGPGEASGRGLRLVAALASEWGVEPTAHGKTVWAQLQP